MTSSGINDSGSNMEKHTRKADSDRWGYAVCFGTVITFIAGIGHVNSFGLIYNDFMNETHSSAKSITAAHGVFGVMLAIGGIILNILSKRISFRLGGLIGSIIMCIGSISTIFISNTNQLPLTFGVFQGVGFGMMVPVTYATLNHFYVRKRTTVMSICKAIQGIMLILYPQVIKIIMLEYGFRGTLLIMSGISLHTLPGMLTMTKGMKLKNLYTRTANDVENGDKDVKNSLINVSINDATVERNDTMRSKVDRFGQEILEILNVKALKDSIYCNICIGLSFVNFSDIMFFMLLPMLLFQYGYSKSQVATCISICAGADVSGRCALAVISIVLDVNTRLLYFVSSVLTILLRILILQVRDFIWVSIVTALLGILRAWIHVTSPLVISNHVSHQDFPGAYALYMLSCGIVHLTLSPVIGLLKDAYEDYTPAFYGLIISGSLCLVLWPLEYIIKQKS